MMLICMLTILWGQAEAMAGALEDVQAGIKAAKAGKAQ